MERFHVRRFDPLKNMPKAPMTLCKNNIPATTIKPNGSWALVFPYILPKIAIKIPKNPHIDH